MHTFILVLILLWLPDPLISSSAPAPANSTSEPLSLKASKNLQLPSDLGLNAAEVFDYLIPGTAVKIHFILGSPLHRTVMYNTILSAYDYITATIASKGESVLPTSEDPFMYDKGYGAFIAAHSAKGRHLTWSFLEGAVVGLHNGLYLRGVYRTSEFWIWDGVAGLVGVGEMGVDVVADVRVNETARWSGITMELVRPT